MKRLKIELNCGKSRWICSAFCTSFLISLIFVLPFMNLYTGLTSAPESSSENTVSIVTVKKRKKVAPVQKSEKKITVPKENVIPREQKVEEKIEETQENPLDEPSESELAENQEGADATENMSESAEPSLSDSEKKALASYKSYALGRIASKKMYPYSARSKGLEGKVRVRIVINPDGSVSETEILEKCEHELLNEACLSAIKKSAPFKKMPKGQKALSLTFVMDFSLK